MWPLEKVKFCLHQNICMLMTNVIFLIIIRISLVATFIGCNQSSEPECFEICRVIPYVFPDGSVYKSETKMDVFVKNGYRIFKYEIESQKYFNEELTSIDFLPEYFIKKDDSANALYLDYKKSPPKWINLDSVLRNRGPLGIPDRDRNEYILVEDSNSNIDFEKYYVKFKKNETYPDSAIVFYKNIAIPDDISIERKLEKYKDMKVVKIELVYNPYKIDSINLNVPSRRISTSIKNKPLTKESLKTYEDLLIKYAEFCK